MTPDRSVGPDSLERLIGQVERPARYIDREWNAVRDEAASYRVALVYPDTYELGMANQAIQILYACLNALEGVCAERAFVPWKDMSGLLRADGVPLCTLESGTPLADCDLVGITLPHELTYTNILEVLDLSGIPLRSADRAAGDPIVMAGGPCAFNPEPMAPFLDAVLLGEGEEAVAEIVAAHRAALLQGADRARLLAGLAGVDGVYVPSLYREPEGGGALRAEDGAPKVVSKRVIADLDDHPTVTCPVVPYADVVHDRATVEVLRGCTRGCRFCQAGMVYRPVRERSADAIVRDALAVLSCTGYEEISLTSLSSADHSRIGEVARRLRRRLEGQAVTISLPSTRVDAFGVDLARSLGGGSKGGLTFAPEAGTQRLRDVVNKNVTEDDLLDTVRRAFEAGWRRVKLYFMIGLPTETDADVQAIGEVVGRVLDVAREATEPAQRGNIRVAVSVSTFVPKAQTPFQWEGQIDIEEIGRRQVLLRDAVPRKGVTLSWHEPTQSFVEGLLARGGRQMADVVQTAWSLGARYSAWTEEFDPAHWLKALDVNGVVSEEILGGGTVGEPLPWDHLSAGVSQRFLARERELAFAGDPTPDCSAGPCSNCGVCDGLGVDVLVRGERGA